MIAETVFPNFEFLNDLCLLVKNIVPVVFSICQSSLTASCAVSIPLALAQLQLIEPINRAYDAP
ncbi:hypothetical protein BZZ01_21370 [Nostocales cyanobacterium HT-58-2]|nr:hypothetical protein BZZ01_21370 [Nostocales cyanobacterium HT-58-2]